MRGWNTGRTDWRHRTALARCIASPAARYITGAQIVVDGGYSLGTAD
jgi:NAD(P)-dependent dehydrogenase (short-subunit alcohol dehydrogenase family)